MPNGPEVIIAASTNIATANTAFSYILLYFPFLL